MNIHRNVLSIVAGSLLMVALPAGAQVLGGSLGGAMNGTLGGRLGGAGIDGSAAAAGNAGVDASGAFGAAHDRVRQAGGRTREVAGTAVGTARSDVVMAGGASAATVQTAHAAGARAGRRAARSAQTSASVEQSGAARANTPPSGELLLNGAGGASAEKHALGRTLAAEGGAGSQVSANRSGLAGSTYGQGGLSMRKDEPAPTETPPAK